VSTWASLREAQRQTALADTRAAIAVTVDIGDPADLHPTNKQEVGRRLSIAARHLIYGERIPPSGPIVDIVRRRTSELVISFRRDVTGALTMRSNSPRRIRAVRRHCGVPLGRCARAGLVGAVVECGRCHARALRLGRLAGVPLDRRLWVARGALRDGNSLSLFNRL